MPPREAPVDLPDLPIVAPRRASRPPSRRPRRVGSVGWSLAIHGLLLACAGVSIGAAVRTEPPPVIESRVETVVPLEEPEEPQEVPDPLDYTRHADEVELVEVEVPLPPLEFEAPAVEPAVLRADPLAQVDRDARITRPVALRSTAGASSDGIPDVIETPVDGGVAAPEASAATAPAGPPVVCKPKPLATNARPAYPRRARKRGWQGVVVLKVHVSITGDVDEVEVADSSGYTDLDRAARRAALDWRFQPATEDGRAIDMWLLQPVRFEL